MPDADPRPHDDDSAALPNWIVRGGDAAWRLVAMGVVVYFGFQLLQTVSVAAIAVIVALFLASVLWPAVRWLRSHGWRPILATFATLIAAVAVVAGILGFTIPAVASNFEDLSTDIALAGDELRDWLVNGPLGLTEEQIDQYWETALEQLGQFGGENLIGGAAAVVEFITGSLLALIVTFFALKDGPGLVSRLIDRIKDPDRARDVDTGIRVGWTTIAQYMRGIALVGLFDATLIGIGLWIVGVPLVFPLAILVFFGAFFPLIGAFASGLVAVAVAFVNGGVVDALIILAIITAIQQFEGDVILPLIFGQTLRLHPLLILLGITVGGLGFGLFGAFVAVPVIAVIVSVRQELAEDPDSTYLGLARG